MIGVPYLLGPLDGQLARTAHEPGWAIVRWHEGRQVVGRYVLETDLDNAPALIWRERVIDELEALAA